MTLNGLSQERVPIAILLAKWEAVAALPPLPIPYITGPRSLAPFKTLMKPANSFTEIFDNTSDKCLMYAVANPSTVSSLLQIVSKLLIFFLYLMLSVFCYF